jgi:hypothetical protein
MSDRPESINGIFDELKNEIMWLHAEWKIYRQLFAHNDKRIDLLNETAKDFFLVIHTVLINEIQLTLAKLCDTARTGKHENLSLAQLQERIEGLGDQGLSSRLNEILTKLCGDPKCPDKPGKCRAIRDRRHKRLAHFDLKTSIQPEADPLPGVSRQMIEDVLSLVREYMNTIGIHYSQTETNYQNPIMWGTDGDALVALLKDGLDFSELPKKFGKGRNELRSGKWGDA